MTRAAALALWITCFSPRAFAQDATIDSAASDSGGDSASDTGGDDTDDTGTTSDGTEKGAADLAGELGGCQGCATGEGLPLGAGALGLLLVGLSRRVAR